MKIHKNQVPMIELAGVSLPLSRAIILNAVTNTGSLYKSLRVANAAYQVPVGKKLIIIAVKVISENSTGGNQSIGYGDAAATGSIPTNAVTFDMKHSYSLDSSNNGGQPCYYEISAGKYPYAYSSVNNVSSVTALGYLVDV